MHGTVVWTQSPCMTCCTATTSGTERCYTSGESSKCAGATWATSCTFARFYGLNMASGSTLASPVLPLADQYVVLCDSTVHWQ